MCDAHFTFRAEYRGVCMAGPRARSTFARMAKLLEGRVALVTGASSGIGEATALALSVAGARVSVAARRVDRLEQLVERIRHAGGEATVIEADVAQRSSAEAMVSSTIDRFGKLDILVNNAGVMYLGPFGDADPDDFKKMLEVNVLGLAYTARAAVRAMKGRGGHIVNISSVAGRVPFATGAIYTATKYGVTGFSEALRKEVRTDKIRVTVIEPGAVATELIEHVTDPATRKQMDAWFASMRQLRPDDIARAVIYAVSQPDHVDVDEISIRPTDQEY